MAALLRKPTIRIAIWLVAAVALFAACGTDAPTPEAAPGASTPVEAPATPAPTALAATAPPTGVPTSVPPITEPAT
ncbi:MAG: phosphate-binding protein, partial [Acidimicrobiia bacterium]|nr:phosphate-binding protein [Acidimicrobiia bacterium]